MTVDSGHPPPAGKESSSSAEPPAEPKKSGGWGSMISGGLALMMPVFAVMGLGSQMGLRTARSRLDWLRTVPEHRQLAALTEVPAGTTVLLHGRLAPAAGAGSDAATGLEAEGEARTQEGLLIYSERDLRAPGRRFAEDLPQVFPIVDLELTDGRVRILPSSEGERPLHDAPHTLVGPTGDWEREGFRAGDMVSIQGKWAPSGGEASSVPTLEDATGLSGQSKAEMSAELDRAWTRVSIFGWICSALALAGLVSLILRWRAARASAGEAA
jgi:hypothetical protein